MTTRAGVALSVPSPARTAGQAAEPRHAAPSADSALAVR